MVIGTIRVGLSVGGSTEKSLMWILDCVVQMVTFPSEPPTCANRENCFLAVIMRISEARTSTVMLCPRRVNAVASYKAPPAVL